MTFILKREEKIENWETLHKKELLNVYTSPLLWVIKRG
jgi:hypothetical protein